MPILLEEQLLYPLPAMHKVRQNFPRPRLDDVEAQVRKEFSKEEISSRIKPGARVAVAVGSRGIKNLQKIVKEAVNQLKSRGAEPFIVSAMGSHGGGTPEGQREVLASYGITEENIGVSVVTSVDVNYIGQTSCGVSVWFDRAAMEADLIVPINRVKLHTDFVGDIQSGLCKMLVIGLGNQKGCSAVHEAEFDHFAEILMEASRMIMDKAPVGFGIAILENAYDETAMVETVPSEKIIEREKELVKIAKSYMPTLMIPDIDVLIVDEIGKNISGSGFDPNILGKSFLLKKFVLPVPKIKRMVLFDVTDESHGNAVGVGIFDVITRKVLNKLNLPLMYANALAVKSPEGSKIPITADTEEEAIRFAIQLARGADRDHLKIVRIKNTLELGVIEVSDELLPYAAAHEKLEVLS
ncbi:MAG: lactate racemase domain-containing protein [Pyramidobacter sp.]|nr:lactate racemase domain-containing protein [Pyramidobacter sp.]